MLTSQISEERARFEWVVENSSDGYVLVDGDKRVIYANPKARVYLRLSEDQQFPTAKTIFELIEPWYRCEPQEAWTRWQSGEKFEDEDPLHLIRTETETTPALWLQISMLNQAEADLHQTFLQLRDVTDQVSRARDMWTFHKLVAHKLRTPLTSLLYSLSMLDDFDSALSHEEIKDLVRTARLGSNELYDTIEDILRYMKAPSLAHTGDHCTVEDIPALIERIQNKLELSSIQFVNAIEADLAVIISPMGMEWILEELLENAKKFHPQKDPNVEIDLSEGETGEIWLRIEDDGIGLPPEALNLVWRPYYQVERKFTGQVDGVGLGLSMVASILWEVGATFQISNRHPESGVVINTCIPVAE